ncbi:MAG: hypothetical protein AAGD25_29225 [Cyanobacteria bacterium P01_F01_bin.150]
MNRTFKWLTGISVAVMSTVMVGNEAIAQEVRPIVDGTIFPLVSSDLAEQMEEVFYTNGKPYYTNRGIPRQIAIFLGTSFGDNEITNDAELIHEFANQLWEEQAKSGPLIRTQDLPNPYQSSLLLEPTIAEQEFEGTFIRQPIAAPPTPTVTTPRQGNRPVQALW